MGKAMGSLDFKDITVVEIARDILYFPKILTRKHCEDLITLAVSNGFEITSTHNQKFKSGDFHLEDKKDLVSILQPYLDAASHYWGCKLLTISELFVNQFPWNGLDGICPHHDDPDNIVSGSVKLNNTYTGGALTFPRQNFTTEELNVGDLILWPSNVTHLHYAPPVDTGIKHNLTIWSY